MGTPNKLLLVVDTWVLASIAENQPEWGESLEVLAKIFTNCHSVAIDVENKVVTEYRSYLNKEKLLQKWFTEMMSKGKIKFRGLTQIPLKVYLTDDDRKFVELVVNTPDRIIITGDSDFLQVRSCPDFASRNITVLNVTESRRRL